MRVQRAVFAIQKHNGQKAASHGVTDAMFTSSAGHTVRHVRVWR
ncbi:hypothetical protein [Myroides odoratus]